MSRRVSLHIERIVLHGVEVARPERLAAELARVLEARIAAEGLPPGWSADRAMLLLPALTLPSTDPEAVAGALAGALLASPAGKGAP